MAEKKNVRFIRIRGRVVPIKINKNSDKYKSASIKAGAGIGAATIASVSGLRDFKKSWKFHRKSSDFASMTKMVAPKSMNRLKFSKRAKIESIKGLKSSKIGSRKLAIGIGIGSFLLGSAINDLFKGTKQESIGDEVSTVATGAIGAISAGFIARKFGLRARSVESLNRVLKDKGQFLRQGKISKIRGIGLGMRK